MDKRRRTWVWVIAVIVLATLTYPLAFGPFLWFSLAKHPPDTIRMGGYWLFTPLLDEAVWPKEDRDPNLYNRYLLWWIDRAYRDGAESP